MAFHDETTGNAYTDLEKRLRPGADSQVGFLGPADSLADTLAQDDATVKRLGLTHATIADALEKVLDRVYYPSKNGTPVDGHWLVSGTAYRGSQHCPWGDAGTRGNLDLTIENIRNKTAIKLPGLIGHLIRAHGFYEGKGSPYRVDPEQLARVLDLLPE